MPDHLTMFQRRLHQWYATYGRRELPWRNTPDPYAIYVSEVMLQQTQVKTVLERFYHPFLQRFPTLQALASANRNEVLQAWQGLGYYSRALNLHQAAQLCKAGLPGSAEALMALPGIGRNTAHAIAAFAFKQPVAVMEANVKRVLARIFALTAPQDTELWEKAGLLMDKSQPFDYNQAMMDLGALVCTKRAPACHLCPAHTICKGKDSPENYPAPKTRKTIKTRQKKIVVLCNAHNHYYATPRTSRFLGGLFHFIETDTSASHIILSDKDYSLNKARFLGPIRQQYSHFTLEAEVWLLKTCKIHGKHWYPAATLMTLPMSMAEHKILDLLGIRDDSRDHKRITI